MEVEALEGDSELNLVTEVWVEPQYGRVGPGAESWKHLRDLTYYEIPRAVSDLRSTPTPYQVGYRPFGNTTACIINLCVLNVCDSVGFLESWRPASLGKDGLTPDLCYSFPSSTLGMLPA